MLALVAVVLILLVAVVMSCGAPPNGKRRSTHRKSDAISKILMSDVWRLWCVVGSGERGRAWSSWS